MNFVGLLLLLFASCINVDSSNPNEKKSEPLNRDTVKRLTLLPVGQITSLPNPLAKNPILEASLTKIPKSVPRTESKPTTKSKVAKKYHLIAKNQRRLCNKRSCKYPIPSPKSGRPRFRRPFGLFSARKRFNETGSKLRNMRGQEMPEEIN